MQPIVIQFTITARAIGCQLGCEAAIARQPSCLPCRQRDGVTAIAVRHSVLRTSLAATATSLRLWHMGPTVQLIPSTLVRRNQLGRKPAEPLAPTHECAVLLFSTMRDVTFFRCIGVCTTLIAIAACHREVARKDSSMPDVQNTSSTQASSTTILPVPSSASRSESSLGQEATAPANEAPSGWGDVAWGMTESEVRAAYPSVGPINPPDDYDRAEAFAKLALSGVQAADLEFTAKFLFGKRTNRLVMVLLSRQPERPSEYTQVFSALTGKYGSPVQSKELNVTSLDRSSPEQERKTRIGSASSSWVTPNASVGLEYIETVGIGHLIVSYKPRPDDHNL